MMCRVFTTEQYMYPVTELPLTSGTVYHTGNLPNIQSVRDLVGLWSTDGSIVLMVTMDTYAWPSWSFNALTFGALTGAYSSSIDGPGPISYYWHSATVADGGDVWIHDVRGQMLQIDSQLAPTGLELDPADYGLISLSVVGVSADYLLIGGDGYGPNRQAVTVVNRASLEHERVIPLPEDPVAFAHGDRTQWYVLLRNGAVVSFDGSTGQILQYTQMQLGFNLEAEPVNNVRFAWDRARRRFLVVRYTEDYDASPGVDFPDDEVPKECTVYIHGYRNAPIATHVCEPVPLAPPREGETVNFLTRRIGDAGEPIAGEVVVDASTGVTIGRGRANVDGDGDARISVTCGAEGAGSIDVVIEVACTIDAPAIDNPFNTPQAEP